MQIVNKFIIFRQKNRFFIQFLFLRCFFDISHVMCYNIIQFEKKEE